MEAVGRRTPGPNQLGIEDALRWLSHPNRSTDSDPVLSLCDTSMRHFMTLAVTNSADADSQQRRNELIYTAILLDRY